MNRLPPLRVDDAPQPRRTALVRHRWLLCRRVVQFTVLGLFIGGPALAAATGLWILKGNLSSSLLLGTVPMTDPFVLLQTLAAGHWPYATAWIGAGVVTAFYLLVGGRAYCSWVCPVNVVTDSAAWLRRRMGLKGGRTPPRQLRTWLLGAVLIVCALTGVAAWELVNPVSMLHRTAIFGGALAWVIVAGVFLYDLLLAPRGWCGHLCPMGATYALINHGALLRVSASARARCDDCMDCFAVCPEPQVIRPALKGTGSPLIRDAACTQCARCLDVCTQDVFRVTHRFASRREPS